MRTAFRLVARLGPAPRGYPWILADARWSGGWCTIGTPLRRCDRGFAGVFFLDGSATVYLERIQLG